VVTVQSLPDQTPSLRAEFPGGPANTTFTVRGVGQRDIADQNEAAVVLFRDGAYVAFPPAASMPLYDLERVEVLRGPQGTLFGRNATGGLIHVVSRRPGDSLDGYARITVGSDYEFGFEGAVGGPLSDTVGARLSVFTLRRDGFIENSAGPDVESLENYSARFQLLFEPSDTLELHLIGYVNRYAPSTTRGHDSRALVFDPAQQGPRFPTSRAEFTNFCATTFATAPLFGFTLAPPGSERFGNCFTAFDDDPYTVAVNRTRYESTYYGATATMNWEFAEGLTLTSITDYQSIDKTYVSDVDSTTIDSLFHFDSLLDGHQFSQELRLAGDSGPFRWVVGGYYLNIDAGVDVRTGLINNPSLFADFFADITQDTESWALFGQGEYDLSEQLRLILGARWTHDRKDLVNVGSCVNNPVFGFIPPGALGPGFPAAPLNICTFYAQFVFPDSVQFQGYDDGFSDGDWNGRAQVEWRPQDDLLLYAGVNRGTKSGGFNAGGGQFYSADAVRYDGEVLVAYEAGVRSTIGPATRINASVFYYDYSDYQSYLTVGGFLRTINVDAHAMGAELEISARPVRGLNLDLGIAWLDATQEDVPLPVSGTADFVMPNAPEWSINGAIRYEWELLGGRMTAQADGAYVSRRTTNAIDYPDLASPSYFRANARLAYTTADDRWELAAFVRNLTDEEVLLFTVDLSGLTGGSGDIYDRDRWFGGSLTWRFGS
ncbi:MAG: TonB-dependent receptor, partial [Allosphingosinicella sp.]